MNLNDEMTRSFLTLDSAVAEIEEIAKAINPFGCRFASTKYTHKNYNFNHHDLNLLIKNFSEFMPTYEIDEIVNYVDQTGSEAPLMIVELNIEKYRSIIQDIETIDQVKRLKNMLNGGYKNLNELCDSRLHELKSTSLLKTSDITTIESIIIESSMNTQIYELAVEKAVEIYQSDLAKLTNSNQVDEYLDNIKARGVILCNLYRCGKGQDFKLFSAHLIEHLLLRELQSIAIKTNSLEKISKIHDLAIKYCIDSVSGHCEDSLSILIRQIIRTADDKTFQDMYHYCPTQLSKHFLSKWLSKTNDNSLNNLLIYREYALDPTRNRLEAKKALKKVSKMFENVANSADSFAKMLTIMQHVNKIEAEHGEKLKNIFSLNVEIRSMVIKIIESTTGSCLDDAVEIAKATGRDKAIIAALSKACLWQHPSTSTIQELSKYPFFFDIKDLIDLDDDTNQQIKSIFEHEIAMSTSNKELSLLYERVNKDIEHPTLIDIRNLIAEKAYSIIHKINK